MGGNLLPLNYYYQTCKRETYFKQPLNIFAALKRMQFKLPFQFVIISGVPMSKGAIILLLTTPTARSVPLLLTLAQGDVLPSMERYPGCAIRHH